MNKAYQKILDDAARTLVPDSLDLFPRLETRLRQRGVADVLRGQPLLALVIAVLILALLTGVAYAIGRAMGYIPGVGFVDTGSFRVLAEPVSQTRDGVIVTIEQVVVDTERTVVVYGAEGLTIAGANSRGEGAPLGSQLLLRLPDGTALREVQESGYAGAPEPLIDTEFPKGGWPNYRQRLVFPAIGDRVEELTLVIPVLTTMPPGAAPENWQLTFHLQPAPLDTTVVPITMMGPATQASSGAAATTEVSGTSVSPSAATEGGITLRLESVLELDDGYVLTGRLTWTDEAFPTGKGVVSGLEILILTDAQGRRVPIEEVQLSGKYTEHEIPWSYRTNRKAFSGPMTLTIPSLNTVAQAPDVDFDVDLGSETQIGRTWEINRDFAVEGHTIRLLSVSLEGPSDPCWRSRLEFKFTGDGAAIPWAVNDTVPDQPLQSACVGGGGGGGGGPGDPAIFHTMASYSTIPSGMHHFTMSVSMPIVVEGPWQVVWEPPLVKGPTPTAEAEACLTLEEWDRLKDRSEPLPPGLGGSLLVSVDAGVPSPMPEPGPSFPEVQISKLDGTERSRPVRGGWPALSPDGTRLVYMNEKGLHLLDLRTGVDSTLGVDGYSPVWSPDGSRILYAATPGLGVMEADGSESRPIDVGGAEITPPVGWLPDNETIIYSFMTGKGFGFVKRNLMTSELTELPLSVQNKWGYVSLSPDGQWVAFMDHVFGASSYGVFVSRVNGTDRRLIVAGDVPTSYRMSWSPNGEWLLVSTLDYQDPASPVPGYRPALIELTTCRAIVLADFGGDVEGWVR